MKRTDVGGRRTARWGVAALLVLAGCAGGDETPSGEPDDRLTTTVSQRTAVLVAYRAHWDAFEAASEPPDPDHPTLRRTAAGKHLKTIRGVLRSDADVGFVRRGRLELHPRVVELDDHRAVVEDCYLDHYGVFVSATGQVVTETHDEVVKARFTLRRLGGAWKVVERDKDETGCELPS